MYHEVPQGYTVNLNLLYSKDKLREFIGFSDADWAGDVDDRKSIPCYMFQVNRAAVSWRSKK